MHKLPSVKYRPGFFAALALVSALFGSALPQTVLAAPPAGQVTSDSTAPALFVPYTPSVARDAAVVREPQVVRAQTVLINLPLLTAAADTKASGTVGQAISLNLFDDVSYVAEPDQVRRTAGGLTWIGKLRGVALSQVVIVTSGDVVSGNISSPEGRYHIRSIGNGLHEVQKIDQSRFPQDETTVPIPPPGSAMDTYQAPTAARDDGSMIDVMVIYTATTRAAAGGTPQILSQIDLAVAETNQAYLSSGVTQRIRLVHAAEVAYTEPAGDGLSAALTCITSTSDGCLDGIHALRDTYGADLVSFWMENQGGGGACGIAYLLNGSSALGFSAVARSCATGYYSFGHELGHNMGLRHDAYMDPAATPYAWQHGYTNPGAVSPWRTVMAYNNACAAVGKTCTRIPYFSNPTITIHDGTAMGDAATADNHRVLNDTASTVANFRQAISVSCNYSLGAASASFSAGATSGSFSLTTTAPCAWTAVSNVSWLTITSATAGSGSVTISYSVGANPGANPRSGAITVGAQTFTVTQSGVPSNATNLILNPGFESGTTSWTQVAGHALIVNNPGAGANGSGGRASFGGSNNITDILYQDIAIPLGIQSAKLKFWYSITTLEVPGAPYDYLAIEVFNPVTNAKLATLGTLSNLNSSAGWIQSTEYNLSAYRGQTVRLKFTATLDSSYSTTFQIDDVSLVTKKAGVTNLLMLLLE